MDARRHVSNEGNIQRQSSHSQHHAANSPQQSRVPQQPESYGYFHPSLPSMFTDGILIPNDEDATAEPAQEQMFDQSFVATTPGSGGSNIPVQSAERSVAQNIDPRLLSNDNCKLDSLYESMSDWLVDELDNFGPTEKTSSRADGLNAMGFGPEMQTQLASGSTAGHDRSPAVDGSHARSHHGSASGTHMHAIPPHQMPPPASMQEMEPWPAYLHELNTTHSFSASPLAGPSRPAQRRRHDSEDSFAEPAAQRVKKECEGCAKVFYSSKDPEGKRCTRCHNKFVKNSSGPTNYAFDGNIDILQSWHRLYPQMPPLNLAGDDVQQEAANEQDYVRRLIEAVNQPYVSDESGSKEDNQRLAQQAKLNKKPHDSQQYRADLVNMRLRFLFAIAHSYHAGGSSFYDEGGDNSGYGEDRTLPFSVRLEKLIQLLTRDKDIAMDVIEGRGVTALVKNPEKYQRRKRDNKKSNDTKQDLQEKGKKFEEQQARQSAPPLTEQQELEGYQADTEAWSPTPVRQAQSLPPAPALHARYGPTPNRTAASHDPEPYAQSPAQGLMDDALESALQQATGHGDAQGVADCDGANQGLNRRDDQSTYDNWITDLYD